MTTEDMRALSQLKLIKRTALMHYPYADDTKTDPQLLLALGEIAGIAGKWIDEFERKHR